MQLRTTSSTNIARIRQKGSGEGSKSHSARTRLQGSRGYNKRVGGREVKATPTPLPSLFASHGLSARGSCKSVASGMFKSNDCWAPNVKNDALLKFYSGLYKKKRPSANNSVRHLKPRALHVGPKKSAKLESNLDLQTSNRTTQLVFV